MIPKGDNDWAFEMELHPRFTDRVVSWSGSWILDPGPVAPGETDVRVVEHRGILPERRIARGCLAQHEPRAHPLALEQRAHVMLDQIPNPGVRDLGVDPRLVEQAEVVDRDALFAVLLEIAEVIQC